MRLVRALIFVTIVACVVAAYQQTTTSGSHQQTVGVSTPANASEQPQAATTQEVNERFAKQFRERIAGHEKEPASKVFKNMQLPGLKDVPAANLINIMNLGYSRALGVTCTHCHVEQDFSSDEQRPKRAAREMAVMHRAINEQLGKMQNLDLKPEERLINCSTCHRGAVNPRSVQSPSKPAGE